MPHFTKNWLIVKLKQEILNIYNNKISYAGLLSYKMQINEYNLKLI